MSTSSKQALIGLAAIAVVLLAIAGDAAFSNRDKGLRATVLSAHRAVPGERVTVSVSARDTDGSVQRIHLDFGDGTSTDTSRAGSCHRGPGTQQFDFDHTYADRADYTVTARVTSDGCGARLERATALRGISVKPLGAE